MKTVILIFICIFLTASVYASEPINDQNWKRHPEVKLIRTLYSQVNAAQDSGKLKMQEKKCIFNNGSVEINVELYSDQEARVRKYVIDGGTGDSRGRAEYYYNEMGIQRFTYRFSGAFNGTEVEERIYFDEMGKQIYTNRKTKGPGYNANGLTDAVTDPKTNYAELCNE